LFSKRFYRPYTSNVFAGTLVDRKYQQDSDTNKMPKLATPLSEKQILELAPKDRRYKVSDGHGLYLLVEPTGKKRWRMTFRLMGKQNTASFGAYPEISLADARQLCADARRLIAIGIDPVKHKQEQRKQAQANRPETRKFLLSMNDQGGMVIDKSATRMVLSVAQVTALRAFLNATNDEIQGE
jgi:hypothetical protein